MYVKRGLVNRFGFSFVDNTVKNGINKRYGRFSSIKVFSTATQKISSSSSSVNKEKFADEQKFGEFSTEKMMELNNGEGKIITKKADTEEEKVQLQFDKFSQEEGEGCLSIKSPILQSPQQSQSLPFMLIIPGFEDSGLPSKEYLQYFSNSFELRCLSIPTSNRQKFSELVQFTKKFLEKLSSEIPSSRPIYVLGESFGALLAMAVSIECHEIIDRLILINPASSILRTNWPQIVPFFSLIPENFQKFAPFAALPLIANPLQFNQNINQQILQNIQILQEQIFSLQNASMDGVVWKFKCMEEGGRYMEKIGIKNIQIRTLIITGDQDRFLPSSEEGEILQKNMLFAKTIELKNFGHLILQQKNFDLLKILKENNFYVEKRNMTSYPKNNNKRTGNNYFKPGPIEIPNTKELFDDKKSIFFEEITKIYAPVFLSTDKDGKISHGIENIPKNEQILFIGNHQPTIADFAFIVEKFLTERGTLIRTLAHPALEQISKDFLQGISKYGVLPVTPKNMFKLMNLGETTMMLPGGAREALKSVKTQKYQLFWSENAEFVRMASKFGVTIVPFSSIGAEDGFNEILSSQEVLKIPFIGEQIKKNNQQILKKNNPRAWQGGSTEAAPLFVAPLGYPVAPRRYYIKFGAPIQTKKEWVDDKEKCTEVYQDVQNTVQNGLKYLQMKRNEDPYDELLPRIIYEANSGFKNQPPTFKP